MSGSTENDVVLGALKLTGKADCECFTSWVDFINKLPSFFSVEVPNNITNVDVSVNQPDDDSHDHVWFRLDTSGSFVGIFIYATGDWRQIWPIPNGVYTMVGSSLSIPAGYQLVDNANPLFTAAEVAALQATWIPDPSIPGAFRVFQCTYVGF